jgi:murein DD-endopeptidase MepM/ murein hydrolase activator NlpD
MLRLTPPTVKGFISSTWGRPREYRDGWHEGLDFPTPVNSPVLAAADGEVVRVDNVSDSFAGKHIVIHHGGGMHSRYLHNTTNLVKVGDKVKRGQEIAKAGTTGTSGAGAPHVHFDLKFAQQAHAAYESRYGEPSTGWGASMSGLGRGVPAETFMDKATYSPQAEKWAKDRGVVFYQGRPVLALALALGAAVGGYFIFVKK